MYPVYAVLYGRSGKTLFTRIAARSMFGSEKMIRSGQFTANRALGLRDMLGAIPLLIDDVTRDKFTSHVPDLVRTDQEVGGQYADHQPRRCCYSARSDQAHGHLPYRCCDPGEPLGHRADRAARTERDQLGEMLRDTEDRGRSTATPAS